MESGTLIDWVGGNGEEALISIFYSNGLGARLFYVACLLEQRRSSFRLKMENFIFCALHELDPTD